MSSHPQGHDQSRRGAWIALTREPTHQSLHAAGLTLERSHQSPRTRSLTPEPSHEPRDVNVGI